MTGGRTRCRRVRSRPPRHNNPTCSLWPGPPGPDTGPALPHRASLGAVPPRRPARLRPSPSHPIDAGAAMMGILDTHTRTRGRGRSRWPKTSGTERCERQAIILHTRAHAARAASKIDCPVGAGGEGLSQLRGSSVRGRRRRGARGRARARAAQGPASHTRAAQGTASHTRSTHPP